MSKGKKNRRIGGYEVLEELGRGAMGVVFKARQISLDRLVALKFLPKRLSLNPASVQRFLQEARLAGQLNHPHIVMVYDTGQVQGLHYIAMEYVDGEAAGRQVKRHGRFKEKACLEVGIAVAKALEVAHGQGILHRDIKPDNILIDRKGVAKLADLGLALLDGRSGPENPGLTAPHAVIGTPYYMSPEQARARTLDARSDLYSLGATLYFLASGQPPFVGANTTDVLLKVCMEPPIPLGALAKDCTPAFAQLVHRLLEKDAALRAQSAGDVLRTLERIRDSSGALSFSPEPRFESSAGHAKGPPSAIALRRQALEAASGAGFVGGSTRPATAPDGAIPAGTQNGLRVLSRFRRAPSRRPRPGLPSALQGWLSAAVLVLLVLILFVARGAFTKASHEGPAGRRAGPQAASSDPLPGGEAEPAKVSEPHGAQSGAGTSPGGNRGGDSWSACQAEAMRAISGGDGEGGITLLERWLESAPLGMQAEQGRRLLEESKRKELALFSQGLAAARGQLEQGQGAAAGAAAGALLERARANPRIPETIIDELRHIITVTTATTATTARLQAPMADLSTARLADQRRLAAVLEEIRTRMADPGRRFAFGEAAERLEASGKPLADAAVIAESGLWIERYRRAGGYWTQLGRELTRVKPQLNAGLGRFSQPGTVMGVSENRFEFWVPALKVAQLVPWSEVSVPQVLALVSAVGGADAGGLEDRLGAGLLAYFLGAPEEAKECLAPVLDHPKLRALATLPLSTPLPDRLNGGSGGSGSGPLRPEPVAGQGKAPPAKGGGAQEGRATERTQGLEAELLRLGWAEVHGAWKRDGAGTHSVTATDARLVAHGGDVRLKVSFRMEEHALLKILIRKKQRSLPKPEEGGREVEEGYGVCFASGSGKSFGPGNPFPVFGGGGGVGSGGGTGQGTGERPSALVKVPVLYKEWRMQGLVQQIGMVAAGSELEIFLNNDRLHRIRRPMFLDGDVEVKVEGTAQFLGLPEVKAQ